MRLKLSMLGAGILVLWLGCRPPQPSVQFHFEPNPMDFGRWAPGACSDRQLLSIVNESDLRLIIGGARTAHFQTPYLLANAVVEPHARTSMEVVFVSDPDVVAAYSEDLALAVDAKPPDGTDLLQPPAHVQAQAVTELGAPCGPFLTCPGSGVCSGPFRCVCDVQVHTSDRSYSWSCAVGPATPGVACDDLNPCTAGDHCTDDAGQCQGTPAPSTPCDDGNLCTENDTCQADGRCTGSSVACITPPTTCADDTHQWIYSYPGTCDPPGGTCSYYRVGVIACGNGCDVDAGTCR